jgi:nucleoside-diphosphate-sugar epimerase
MTYGRRFNMTVRIARFQNCYGPEGTWQGGREKAPAAICRKVAKGSEGGEVEVGGDGSAVRSYTYVDDMVDGPPNAIGEPRHLWTQLILAPLLAPPPRSCLLMAASEWCATGICPSVRS